MPPALRPRPLGFTLIELVVTLAVLATLAVIAVPSFLEYRQRAALRGAADQVLTFWGDARFEALRRNTLVKVNFVTDGDDFCLGAETTDDPADDEACDCLTQACNVANYPADQSEWNAVRVASAASIGEDSGILIIDPKRATITDAADVGRILLRSPAGGSQDYRLDVAFDLVGRAVICEPSDAPSKLPQYSDRRC